MDGIVWQGRFGGDRGDRAFGGDRGDRGDREERGPRRGEEEDMGPSRADEDKDWGKSKKFVPSADGPRRGGPGMMGGRSDGPPGREEREVRSLVLAIDPPGCVMG